MAMPVLPPLPARWGRAWLAAPLLAGLGGAAWDLGALPRQAGAETLRQSRDQRGHFPFRADCAGNAQEMVACLWERRNADDQDLLRLLGGPASLEPWRASRHQVCGRAAAKAQGGSVFAIVWLSCENDLNAALLRQIRKPLLQGAER